MNTQNNAANNASSNVNAINATMHALVPRRDYLGSKMIFLAETQDREKGTVQYWDGKKGSKPATVPMAFYKTTLPLETEEDTKSLVQAFSKEFGVKEVVLRKRLIKESVLKRDDAGNVAPAELDSYKTRLIAAITKAIQETM